MYKVFRKIVTVVALAVFILSGYKLMGILSTYRAESKANQQVADQFVHAAPLPTQPAARPTQSRPGEEEPLETTEPFDPSKYAPISVDFEAIWEMNSDVVGWIYSPDTPISYPIVCTANNTDYLRRGLDGAYRHGGTIFLDYRCEKDFSDYNSIIYGHNLLDSSMFGTLERYQEQSYYESHPTLYLLTPEADYRVDLIGGLGLDARSALYRTEHTFETYRDFLESVLSQSNFMSGHTTEGITRTLTLSTCSYGYDDARYIIVGALTPLARPESE